MTCAKSLLAVAVAAAIPAVASAQVVVSGIIKGGVSTTTYSGGTGTGYGSALGVNDGSSRLIISGTEKLNQGMSAFFQIDTRFRVDDNGGGASGTAPTSGVPSQLATGNTFVGLSGGFGALQIGKMDTHYCSGADQHGVRATALTASSCALLGFVNGNSGAAAIANASRSTNVIRYTSPTMSGFTLALNHSTSWAGSGSEFIGTAGKGNANHGQLVYSAGPITAGLSNWDAKSEDKTTGQKGLTAWGAYDVGPVNIGLTWDESSTTDAGGIKTQRTVTSVPVRFMMGAGTFLATWSRADDTEVAGAKAANTGASLFSIGYVHDLSKRTSIGISYGQLNNDPNGKYGLYTQASLSGLGAPNTGSDQKQTYIGVRHVF